MNTNSNVVLTINMGKKCAECGENGVTPSGLCMRCGLRAMREFIRPMKSPQGKALRERMKKIKAECKL